MSQKRSLILGHGYVAGHLRPRLESQGGKVYSTSRSDQRFLAFDLENPDTWENIPKELDETYWTFPATPLDLVTDFLENHGSQLGQIVVIGSTSGFLVKGDNQEVTEATALDRSQARVEGEEFLRSQGAITLMSAGIYGPGRDPLDWVKKGYVGRSDKKVNMIHVEDLCSLLIAASEQGKSGTLYIGSDNSPQVWRDVIDQWQDKGWVQDVPERSSKRQSKSINSSQSLAELGVSLQYPNFVDRVL